MKKEERMKKKIKEGEKCVRMKKIEKNILKKKENNENKMKEISKRR